MNLERILRCTQWELKNMLCRELEKMCFRPEKRRGFLYAEGTVPVLLAAHLDTVHRNPVRDICVSKQGNILMSPQGIGGDDRAGVYMVMELARKLKCSVLFCEDEEIGGAGAELFTKSGIRPSVSLILEFDRQGKNDAVFYDCDNTAFTEFICKFGYHEETGSFSDISILAPYLETAAVNLSAGYYNAHTLHEYIDLSHVKKGIERAAKIIQAADKHYPYIPSQKVPWHFSGPWYDEWAWESHMESLNAVAAAYGMDEPMIHAMLDMGMDYDEIEEILYDPEMRKEVFDALAG